MSKARRINKNILTFIQRKEILGIIVKMEMIQKSKRLKNFLKSDSIIDIMNRDKKSSDDIILIMIHKKFVLLPFEKSV